MTGQETAAAAARELLAGRGADTIAHPGGTLLAHLERVRTILAAWDNAPAVQLAGLCHAAYGTDGFGTALLALSERDTLAAAIGVEAERLVYLYGSCERTATYPALSGRPVTCHDRFTGTTVIPDDVALRAFAEITVANELDIAEHNPALAGRIGPWLLRLVADWSALLTPAARAGCAARLSTGDGQSLDS
jgi:hypothetical protein